MARCPFSLYRRKRSGGGAAFSYYVQFWNPQTATYMPGRSIEQLRESLQLDPAIFSASRKSDAKLVASFWLKEHGIIEAKAVRQFGAYCLSFWDWERSEYIRGLKLRGKVIGKEYVGINHSYIKRFLLPSPLARLSLAEITAAAIESFILAIKEKTGLSNTSCNAIICALGKPLSEAYRLGLIHENPLVKVPKLQRDTAPKGILSSTELQKLFSTSWDDERSRVAALLSVTCGLRLGEVRGLTTGAIRNDRIIVAGSYSKKEGLKSTKNGKVRIVPILPQVKTSIVFPANSSFLILSQLA